MNDIQLINECDTCGEINCCCSRMIEYEKLADKHNLHNADWCMYEKDINEKHNFKSRTLYRSCWCFDKQQHKRSFTFKGDTWLDIWKAINKHIKKYPCNHIFIEDLKEEDDKIKMINGS